MSTPPNPTGAKLEVRCPACGQPYRLNASLRGSRGPCEVCGNVFAVNEKTIVRVSPPVQPEYRAGGENTAHARPPIVGPAGAGQGRVSEHAGQVLLPANQTAHVRKTGEAVGQVRQPARPPDVRSSREDESGRMVVAVLIGLAGAIPVAGIIGGLPGLGEAKIRLIIYWMAVTGIAVLVLGWQGARQAKPLRMPGGRAQTQIGAVIGYLVGLWLLAAREAIVILVRQLGESSRAGFSLRRREVRRCCAAILLYVVPLFLSILVVKAVGTAIELAADAPAFTSNVTETTGEVNATGFGSGGPPPATVDNSLGMRLVLIPAGEFSMGSPDSDSDADELEKPQHRVKIARPFYLGVCEVTQAEYQRVKGGQNPSTFMDANGKVVKDRMWGVDGSNVITEANATLPVETISWDAARDFCKMLSALPAERRAGRCYRLPTEAEWEYACRAGSTFRYGFDELRESVDGYAWYAGNSGAKAHPVGQKKPNAWGLFDMQGNVWEWCEDFCVPYPPKGGMPFERACRGGSWEGQANACRPAARWGVPPSWGWAHLGFRVAATVP